MQPVIVWESGPAKKAGHEKIKEPLFGVLLIYITVRTQQPNIKLKWKCDFTGLTTVQSPVL